VRRIIVLNVLLLGILACALPGAPVSSPTQMAEPVDAIPLETIIVQTAAAAQAQTATAQPTPTQTRFPTSIPIEQPATSTPFSLSTADVPVETLAPEFVVTSGAPGSGGASGGAVPYTGEPWTCVVKSVYPPRGAVVKAGEEFTVTWTVLNTGTKPWTTTTIDFVYYSGFRHEGRGIQDLWRNVPSGGTIALKVLYKAPKNAPKEYRAYWNLRVGNRDFCVMMTEFEVR
jgi:hypothetical protein